MHAVPVAQKRGITDLLILRPNSEEPREVLQVNKNCLILLEGMGHLKGHQPGVTYPQVYSYASSLSSGQTPKSRARSSR
jgi:hypothetical protein